MSRQSLAHILHKPQAKIALVTGIFVVLAALSYGVYQSVYRGAAPFSQSPLQETVIGEAKPIDEVQGAVEAENNAAAHVPSDEATLSAEEESYLASQNALESDYEKQVSQVALGDDESAYAEIGGQNGE